MFLGSIGVNLRASAVPSPPAAPAGLHVTGEVNGQVGLAWSGVAGASSYNVYRSPLSGGGWARANSSPVAGASFTDTGLRNGRTHYYAVRALVSAGNESGPSNEASAVPHWIIGWANLQWPPARGGDLVEPCPASVVGGAPTCAKPS